MATQTLVETTAQMNICADDGVAKFSVGDKCISRYAGKAFVIVSGYSLYAVREADGSSVDRDGARISMRYGYRAQSEDSGKVLWFAAGELLDPRGRCRHLEVVEKPKPAAEQVKQVAPTPARARKTLAALVAQSTPSDILDVVKLMQLGEKGFDRMLERALWRGNMKEMQGELAQAMAARLGFAGKTREASHV